MRWREPDSPFVGPEVMLGGDAGWRVVVHRLGALNWRVSVETRGRGRNGWLSWRVERTRRCMTRGGALSAARDAAEDCGA